MTIQETKLCDYQSTPFEITDVHLKFELDEEETFVTSELKIKARVTGEPLVLNGEDLELISLCLNGKPYENYTVDQEFLTLQTDETEFILEIKTKINPAKNTQLAGLYKSEEILCTQNEAEGFRRITYFYDRPDIMARYSVEIIGDKKKYPQLLSNGNLIESGTLLNGLHYAKWQDPFPKPCYLFALVAGDFGLVQDHYITKSGRKIDLKIFCDKGNENKCHHAMVSLKKSMLWDEETFGLEYDLDLFMIVAVLSFNFGAMENKGLNIFNANAILVDEESATDDNFMRVERIVAHEYFHNWTGNRVTLRDWFQLTLKEGLTVFRDQEFMQDMHSRGVLRVEDVHYLRRFQFPEDSGPTKHPIKPGTYLKIDNFYTTTIYQKGAEVIRMLKTLLGEAVFRKGMDVYFERYDGKAVTTEDFLSAMEYAYGNSLEAFSNWYFRSGTPKIQVKRTEDGLEIIQQEEPLTFPLAVGFLDSEGNPLKLDGDDTAYLKVTEPVQKFSFKNLPRSAVVSLNRHFSAPIKIESGLSKEERLLLMSHDTDAFSRWDAAYELYSEALLEMVSKHKAGAPLEPEFELLEGILHIIDDNNLDPASKALMLTLPSESEIGERQFIIDIDEIHAAREFLKFSVGQKFYDAFLSIWQKFGKENTMGARKLKNTALAYLAASKKEEAFEQIFRQFRDCSNMTDRMAALELLVNYPNPFQTQALNEFYQKWKHDPLVITKWFAVQAGSQMARVHERVAELLKNPSYDEKVPNSVRALLGTFAQNQFHFHEASGKGYELLSSQIIRLDQINAHVSANLAQGFKKFARLDSKRKEMMQRSLRNILKVQGLSPNVFEIASKCVSS